MEFDNVEITKDDIPAILNAAENLWGGAVIVVHGEAYDIRQLPGYKAMLGDELVGFLHYTIHNDSCEILTLASLKEGIGVGSNLLREIEARACQNGVRLIHLIATNDNLHALGFYQRRGYHMTTVFPNQVELSRKIKPSIPEIGDNRIPIRDEIRLEKVINSEHNKL